MRQLELEPRDALEHRGHDELAQQEVRSPVPVQVAHGGPQRRGLEAQHLRRRLGQEPVRSAEVDEDALLGVLERALVLLDRREHVEEAVSAQLDQGQGRVLQLGREELDPRRRGGQPRVPAEVHAQLLLDPQQEVAAPVAVHVDEGRRAIGLTAADQARAGPLVEEGPIPRRGAERDPHPTAPGDGGLRAVPRVLHAVVRPEARPDLVGLLALLAAARPDGHEAAAAGQQDEVPLPGAAGHRVGPEGQLAPVRHAVDQVDRRQPRDVAAIAVPGQRVGVGSAARQEQQLGSGLLAHVREAVGEDVLEHGHAVRGVGRDAAGLEVVQPELARAVRPQDRHAQRAGPVAVGVDEAMVEEPTVELERGVVEAHVRRAEAGGEEQQGEAHSESSPTPVRQVKKRSTRYSRSSPSRRKRKSEITHRSTRANSLSSRSRSRE